MSKEATGQMGVKIGSSEYWSAVNKSTLFGSLMGSRTDYQATIGQLGTKAAAAIEEVYEDLSNLGAKIRYLPSSDRNALAKQVEGLYDICKMSGVSVWHNSECIHGLNLGIMSPWGSSFRDERGIEKAIAYIERSRFSGDAGMKLLQEAARWSIAFAAGGDKEKQEFLETAAQGNLSSRFLQDVAAEYQNRHTIQRYEGRCGYPVGSKAYMTHLESEVFGAGLPILICAASGKCFETTFSNMINKIQEFSGTYEVSGSVDLDFQMHGDTDLYYAIGRCSLKYTCIKSPKTIQIKFKIDDKYDFDHIRLISGDMERFIVIEFEFGNLANDLGLISQADGVISNYHSFISFTKTIELN